MLLDVLEAGAGGRIVNVDSATHHSASLELEDLNLEFHDYSGVRAYAQSKLAIVAWTCLARRSSGWHGRRYREPPSGSDQHRTAARDVRRRWGRPERAAGNIFHAVEARGDVNGTYFDGSRRAAPNPEALMPEVQSRLMAEWRRRRSLHP
jgi:NAD(P)-dependent dehydrogenase (short-subunit alcohol dehydrogenase family)